MIPITSIITETSKDTSNLKAAIAYASMLDWSIFPLWPKSKKPITKNGFKDATNNIKQIEEWWTLYPDAGIGLPTGKINDVVVIDIDPRNNGHLSFDRLIDENEELPHTVHCMTGGGGDHFYFKYDERINKSSLSGYPGLDVQGNGKYVILPPSTHPSGKQYYWEESSKPVVTPIADMPNWLINLLSLSNNTAYQKKESSYWVNLFNDTTAGNRNNAAAKMAGHLFRRYVDPKLTVEIMHLWNAEKVNPPLDGEELNKIINSIARAEFERRSRG